METNKEQMTPEQQNREWAEEAFWTGHCHYLMQALALAMQRCQVWRLAGTDSVFTLIEIFNFAKAYDAEHELAEGQFYRTTVEGAIGICLGAEYLTQWLFTPMEPGAERDALLEELKQKLLDKGAKDVRLCTMLLKPEVFCGRCKLDYVGAEIPNRFIVGFGLDYDELGRNLKDIYVLE